MNLIALRTEECVLISGGSDGKNCPVYYQNTIVMLCKGVKKAVLTHVLNTHCLLFCHCLDNICMWTEREGRRDSTKYGVHKYTHTCGHYGGRECLRR